MKKIILFTYSFLLVTITSAQTKPVMTFQDTMHHNFGTVNEGDSAVHVFDFINTGNTPLVIKEVKTTCFCTASEWPQKPIPPQGSGTIKVHFDTEGKSGAYAKGVNVFSNAGESNLIIYIDVIAKVGTPVEVEEEDYDHDHDHDGHNHGGE